VPHCRKADKEAMLSLSLLENSLLENSLLENSLLEIKKVNIENKANAKCIISIYIYYARARVCVWHWIFSMTFIRNKGYKK